MMLATRFAIGKANWAGAFMGLILASAPAWPAAAAGTLALARTLVHYTGGVTLILNNFEPSLAAKTKAPEIFRQSFDQAMTKDEKAIAAADEAIAHVYAALYPERQLAAEVGFYESPEGRSIMARNRAPTGQVIWPDPGSMNLSPAESAALTKFNATVKARAQVAAKNPKAMDQVLAAETDALIKVRHDAFEDYCAKRDCKAEGVTVP